MNEAMRERLKTVLTGICESLYVRIIRIGMEEDHVHMYVSIPVTQPMPYVVKMLKGRSSKVLGEEFAGYLKQFYWSKKVLWAVGYFIATVGEVNHDTIQKYVENQGKKDIEEECIEIKDSGLD